MKNHTMGALLFVVLFAGCSGNEGSVRPDSQQPPPVVASESPSGSLSTVTDGQVSRSVVLHVTGMMKSKGDAT